MKNKVTVAALILGVLALSGCDETHDVAYFKAHQDEMSQVLTECNKKSPDTWSDNCKNAHEAEVQLKNDSFFSTPKKG
ncbi:EexN family lipoprotein [Escherichia coli]